MVVFAQAFLLARTLPKHTVRAASTGRQLCADAATAESLAVLGVLPMNSAAPYVAGLFYDAYGDYSFALNCAAVLSCISACIAALLESPSESSQ